MCISLQVPLDPHMSCPLLPFPPAALYPRSGHGILRWDICMPQLRGNKWAVKLGLLDDEASAPVPV